MDRDDDMYAPDLIENPDGVEAKFKELLDLNLVNSKEAVKRYQVDASFAQLVDRFHQILHMMPIEEVATALCLGETLRIDCDARANADVDKHNLN